MAAKSAPDFGRRSRLRLALAVIVLAVLGLGLRQARTAALVPTVPDPVPPPPHSLLPRPIPAPPGQTCPLCQPDPSMPIVQMTPADAESLGRAYATFNEALVARADSLLRSGAFGDPERAASRRTAHLLTRILAVNSLHYMVGFSSAPDRIYEASEPTLREAFEHYSDPGVYPIARLRSARMGMGSVCVHYNLEAPLDSASTVGGVKLRTYIEDADLNGRRQRVLVLEVPTLLFGAVDVVLADHFTCKAEFRRSSGPPASYDLYLFCDIDGLYLRKWGLHQPRALGFWATPRDVGRLALPRTPLVGSAVYVPRVRFELPSFLPDLGFEDLRLIEVPQPILSLRYLQSRSYPDWMRRAEPRGFKDWESHGPIPPDLRRRFPDL